MELIQYTPSDCIEHEILGCYQLKAYARYKTRYANMQESRQSFMTIIFTCIILSLVAGQFTKDITYKVEVPIKKIIDIIQKLADEPLKMPA